MDNSLKTKEKTPKRGANAPQEKAKSNPFLIGKELKTKDLRQTAVDRASEPERCSRKSRGSRSHRALQKEYVRAYLASAKGQAAMKRYRQSAKGQAASRTARKKWLESPKGRAALQALRERNKEHQKAYRESPRAGHGLRSRMGE